MADKSNWGFSSSIKNIVIGAFLPLARKKKRKRKEDRTKEEETQGREREWRKRKRRSKKKKRRDAGSPVPGILQARTLEWVAISFSNAGK